MRQKRAIDNGQKITGEEEFNFFMSLVIPQNELMIMDYNRLIKTLNGMSSVEFKTAVS